MILPLSDKSSEPLHAQISRQLRARILAGSLAEGDALDSIRAFAREQKVSVITVQRAYEDLEREGLLRTRRGKGFFVERLTAKRRSDLARKRFTEAFRRLLKEAFAEGLDAAGIERTVRELVAQKVRKP